MADMEDHDDEEVYYGADGNEVGKDVVDEDVPPMFHETPLNHLNPQMNALVA